eukprot:12841123-Alexandrium_andersonii.AAC.1
MPRNPLGTPSIVVFVGRFGMCTEHLAERSPGELRGSALGYSSGAAQLKFRMLAPIVQCSMDL